jgi:hypothetical protein
MKEPVAYDRSVLRGLVQHELEQRIQGFVQSHEQQIRQEGINPEEFPDFIWSLVSEAAGAHFTKKLGRRTS